MCGNRRSGAEWIGLTGRNVVDDCLRRRNFGTGLTWGYEVVSQRPHDVSRELMKLGRFPVSESGLNCDVHQLAAARWESAGLFRRKRGNIGIGNIESNVDRSTFFFCGENARRPRHSDSEFQQAWFDIDNLRSLLFDKAAGLQHQRVAEVCCHETIGEDGTIEFDHVERMSVLGWLISNEVCVQRTIYRISHFLTPP